MNNQYTRFSIGGVLAVIFIAFTFSCNKQTCSVEDGFVSQSDTTLDCRCGMLSMKTLDTLRIKKNQCTILRFQSRALSNWLDNNEVLRIGMEPDAPPAFFTEGAQETGFDYELLKIIFPKVFPGISMQVKGYQYDTLHQLLLQPNPQIEIIAGGYVPDTSLPGVIWTKPYLTYGYALITKETNQSVFSDLASLNGKKVGVYDDGITEEWVRKNVPGVGEIFKAVDNTETPYSDWMQMLAEGKVDAIIYDYPFAVQEINDYDEAFVISNKRLNAPDDLTGYAFGIPAGNARYLKQINEAIDAFKSTPEFTNLVAQFIPDPDKGLIAKTEKAPIPPTTPAPPAVTPASPVKTADNTVKTATVPAPTKTPPTKKVSLPTPEQVAQKKQEEAKAGNYDGETYTVGNGETLSIIAGKILGDIERWEELYILNPHIVSPDIVYSGTILKVPKYSMVKKDLRKWGNTPDKSPSQKNEP